MYNSERPNCTIKPIVARKFCPIFLFVLFLAVVLSEPCSPLDCSHPSNEHGALRAIDETLIYDVNVWGLKVGTLSAKISNTERLGLSHACHIIYRMRTTGLARYLLPVDKIVSVWINSVTGLPYMREKWTNTDGRGYKTQEQIFFDQEKQRVLLTLDTDRGHVPERVIAIVPEFANGSDAGEQKGNSRETSGNSKRDVSNVLDPYSLLYYLRAKVLQSGESHFIVLLSNLRVQRVQIDVGGREIVKVPAGEFECLVVRDANSTMGMWISTDCRRVPVKFTLNDEDREFLVVLNEIRTM